MEQVPVLFKIHVAKKKQEEKQEEEEEEEKVPALNLGQVL